MLRFLERDVLVLVSNHWCTSATGPNLSIYYSSFVYSFSCSGSNSCIRSSVVLGALCPIFLTDFPSLLL
jgi:hypothetical protein